jgi:beta-glucanase (GH16 family)
MSVSTPLAHTAGVRFALSFAPVAALLCACSSASPAPATSSQDDGGAGYVTSEDAGAPSTSPPVVPYDAGKVYAPAPDASASSPNDDAGADAGGSAADDSGSSAIPGWTLVWSDEFNGANGSPVDSTKWQHETGGNNANDELEYYSDSIENSQQYGGNLVITATSDGQGNYTSARINTAGLFSQQYGRFEARAQLPYGQGIWPAFWMLGNNIDQVSWPACGEVDIMETIGTDVGENHGSLHSPGWDPTAVYPLPNGGSLADAFHTYAVEWQPGEIRFYVDDNLYETQDQSGAPGGGWVFDDQPFFIIINVAVGGDWPGNPDSTTVFPQKLLVDWVRVYKAAAGN